MLRPSRTDAIHLALILFAGALVVRAGYVQLWQGSMWAAQARHEHSNPAPPPATRGPILDASGQPLAMSRELFQLSVAPPEVRDRLALAHALARAGVPVPWVRRAVDARGSWIVIPTRVLPGPAAAAIAMRGVYATPVAERLLLGPPGIAAIVGHVAAAGVGSDGIEASLDSLLRGDPGQALVLRDGFGHTLESPANAASPPRPGDVVQLTINRHLQEICDRALEDAVTGMGASGGDIVALDPNDGSILALSSRRPGVGATAAATLTEPFEPGSTLKPFVAAALLSRGRVASSDVVDTHAGFLVLNGRRLTDSHRALSMTLREVIQWSSNVGIAQFAERLRPTEEYEALRDVGFGSTTGLPFPGESPGTLREPRHWSKQSPASLAIGYELAVTPLQLALAYGAIANGGELLEPALVREIQSSDGTVLYHRQRRVVRRVMSPDVARQLREILIQTVARGTATGAELQSFVVAGKTGTARRTEVGAGYERNQYTASFVGLFPGRDPQYVILVKLDNPKGSYYGGTTAAPVSRVILQAALAAHDAALDLTALANGRRVALADTLAVSPPPPPPDTTAIDTMLDTVPARVELGARPALPADKRPGMVSVPDVSGVPLRAGVRALHAAGLRVEITPGPAGVTAPPSATSVPAHSVVRIGDGSR